MYTTSQSPEGNQVRCGLERCSEFLTCEGLTALANEKGLDSLPGARYLFVAWNICL